jgi:branched-subunit amino acid aminotransferase/4-amino-4-deoxychorismate lyase
VLWLDGIEQNYVDEVGSMNMMFVIDGNVVTPMDQRLDPLRHNGTPC